jgi:death-on-curing protein
VLAIHELLLAQHGGSPGLLSDGALDASLASPRNLLSYGDPDVFDLAAKYASALNANHPFRDGNKRVALTVAGVFLELNGQRLEAPEAEAVSAMLALATNQLDEKEFAAWLRLHSAAHRRAPARRAPRAKRSRPRSDAGRDKKRRGR